MSAQLIESLKAQVKSTSDPEQAKEMISLLEVYGYKAVPALRDLLQECSDDEIREYCKEVLKKLGWLAEEH
jgi:transcriptional regulator of met regulon